MNDDNYFSKESFKESGVFFYSEAEMKVISLMIL